MTPNTRSRPASRPAAAASSARCACRSRNPDFSAFVQRAKDLNPQGIFVLIPGGAQPGAFGKAFAERGIDPKKTKVMGQMEITDEQALKSMGDVALGIITSATTTTITSPR